MLRFFSKYAEELFSSSDISGISSEWNNTTEVKKKTRTRRTTAADAKGGGRGEKLSDNQMPVSDKIDLF